MFNLTQIFKNNENLHITPILMNNEPIFFPSELEEQLGYEWLAHTITQMQTMRNGKDYEELEGDKLKELKELLIRCNLNAIDKKASSLVVLKESGLNKLLLRSDKPICQKFADWVVDEVLPSIRKIGEQWQNILIFRLCQ